MKKSVIKVDAYIFARDYLRLAQWSTATTKIGDGKRLPVSAIVRAAVHEYIANHKEEIDGIVGQVFDNPNEFIGVNLEEDTQ